MDNRLTSRLIQRRVTSQFEFGLPSPPWMAYIVRQKMRHLTTLLVTLSMALLFGVADAHQDTPLKLDNGNIVGLPETYLPASFNADELSVTIAGKKLLFPEIFNRLLTKDVSLDPFDGPRKIESVPCTFTFSASWYHERFNVGMPPDQRLPPYMLISIFPTGRPCHFELLIDMEGVRILRADLHVDELGSVPIDLDNVTLAQDKKNGEQAAPSNGDKPSN